MSARSVAAVPRTASVPDDRGHSFLNDIRVDFGPPEVLGRLFLKADTAARERGIRLSFAPVSAMLELNKLNRDSWRPLVPILDSALGGFNDENGFCLLGRNSDGEIIAAHAARLYRLGGATFREEVESLRLWYTDPEQMKAPGEACAISCPSADAIRGQTVFSGGVWFRPDYRKVGLT